jgi:predicted Rossmann-fold nucleotide-binding protein
MKQHEYARQQAARGAVVGLRIGRMRICVYAASSPQAAPVYMEAARRWAKPRRQRLQRRLRRRLAGLMGALADGALARGGEVIGVLPKFMADLDGAIRA